MLWYTNICLCYMPTKRLQFSNTSDIVKQLKKKINVPYKSRNALPPLAQPYN